MLVACVLLQNEAVRKSPILVVANSRVAQTFKRIQTPTGLRETLLVIWQRGRPAVLRSELTFRIVQTPIASEEFLACLRGICELHVVVFGRIKELLVIGVAVVVVLRLLHVEVGVPAKLAENVSFQRDLGILGDSSAFHFIFFVGV